MSRLLLCCILVACFFHVSYSNIELAKSISRARRADDNDNDFGYGYAEDDAGGEEAYYDGDDFTFDEGYGDDNGDDEYNGDGYDDEAAETSMSPTKAPTATTQEPDAEEVTSSPTEAPAMAAKQSTSPYPTISVPDESGTSKPTPTSYPTISVDTGIVTRTLRPTPSVAPTPHTKQTAAPTESIIFKSKYADSGIHSITYFAYTVGFLAIAGGLAVFITRYSSRGEVNYTRELRPNLDDELRGWETEMSNITR